MTLVFYFLSIRRKLCMHNCCSTVQKLAKTSKFSEADDDFEVSKISYLGRNSIKISSTSFKIFFNSYFRLIKRWLLTRYSLLRGFPASIWSWFCKYSQRCPCSGRPTSSWRHQGMVFQFSGTEENMRILNLPTRHDVWGGQMSTTTPEFQGYNSNFPT